MAGSDSKPSLGPVWTAAETGCKPRLQMPCEDRQQGDRNRPIGYNMALFIYLLCDRSFGSR